MLISGRPRCVSWILAASALLALQRTLAERPRRSAQGVSESVQRILAGAHEFRELALLRELRLPDAVLPAERAE